MVVLCISQFFRFDLCVPPVGANLEESAVAPDHEEDSMHCLRCQGFMIAVQMKDVSSQDTASGWRCLICGETTDPGIEANRLGHCPPSRSRARVPGSPSACFG